MDEYKNSEDCFPQKEKFDDLIARKTKKIEHTSIQELDSFIELFHNFSQYDIKDLIDKIEPIKKSIYNYPENERDDLIHYLNNSPLCKDCIFFFQYMCDNLDSFLNDDTGVCYSYFDMVKTITHITDIFTDNPDYFGYVFLLIDNYECFPCIHENLINIIITNILMLNENIDFLSDLYRSPANEKILDIALGSSCDDIYQINSGAQNIIRYLYINLAKCSNDPNIAGEILSTFFDKVSQKLDLGDYIYKIPSNIKFIIRISSLIIESYPDTYSVIYDNNLEYFQNLFEYMTIDYNGKNYSSAAFQLVTLIIRELPREDPPDLKEIIHWDSLINFFNYISQDHMLDLKNMLLFSEAYLRFGSAFFHQFYECDFFSILIGKMSDNELPFKINIIAANCLVTAIIFSGSPTQIYYLFEEGVLPILLSILENDSDDKLTEGILDSIEMIWDSCNNVSDEIPQDAPDKFSIIFRDECGYEILNNLNTCPDKAQHLNDILGDPPNDEE